MDSYHYVEYKKSQILFFPGIPFGIPMIENEHRDARRSGSSLDFSHCGSRTVRLIRLAELPNECSAWQTIVDLGTGIKFFGIYIVRCTLLYRSSAWWHAESAEKRVGCGSSKLLTIGRIL